MRNEKQAQGAIEGFEKLMGRKPTAEDERRIRALWDKRPEPIIDIIDELLEMTDELTCICGIPPESTIPWRKRCPKCKMIGRLSQLKEEAQQGHLWND
jgi:hypothetical protein